MSFTTTNDTASKIYQVFFGAGLGLIFFVFSFLLFELWIRPRFFLRIPPLFEPSEDQARRARMRTVDRQLRNLEASVARGRARTARPEDEEMMARLPGVRGQTNLEFVGMIL